MNICNDKTFALISPFRFRTTQVWLGFVVSIVCVILALIVLQRNMAHGLSEQSRNPKDDEKDDTVSPTAAVHPGKQYIYVFASLLSQGLIRIQ